MFKQHPIIIPKSKSQARVSPIIKAYIFSEAFLWSGWNLVIPIAALFVAAHVKGGNIEVAATGYSIHLTLRVILELISGKYLSKSTDRHKLYAASTGAILVSIALFLFAFSYTIPMLYFSFAVGGLGFGIGAPAKNALFSIHIDKDQETTEWGIADGVTFISMALATALGGFIATQFGFQLLFLIAGSVSLLACIPYIINLV